MFSKNSQGELKDKVKSNLTTYLQFQTDLEEFVFKLYDVNDDGKISFEEFLVMMSIMNNGTAAQKIEQIFR